MSEISTHVDTTTAAKKAKRLWVKVVLVLAVALASVAAVAVEARAESRDL